MYYALSAILGLLKNYPMRKITFIICISLLFVVNSFAQLAMTRSTYTASYTPIGLPTATLSTATGDDVAQSAIPLGFTFNYLGTNYTTIGLNTNGAASFDAVMATSGTNNNLFVATAPNNTLAPWWDNIWSDTVLYQLSGVSPNQTFTIQWTNSLSYFNTATQHLNFQVILHETTNVIEFSYGNLVAGIAAPNESASIGIEGATGGAGNYLDAVTGSAFTSNGMLNAQTQWPSHNFRFTPGAPTAIAAGTYTVGISGNYFSLSEAIADINHRGVAGPVVLSLTDATYDVTPANGDNFFPMLIGPVSGSSITNTISIIPVSGNANIISNGTTNGNCGNAAANNIISNINEPILALVGATYVQLHNLNLSCSNTGVVDRGIEIFNSSPILGSQNNLLQDVSVVLNRNNVTSVAIEQRTLTNPTGAPGANSNNTYFNLNLSNAYSGIILSGNAAFPDLNCVVGNTSPTQFNLIGAATPNDIGNGNTATYGIRGNNESGISIYNNEVRNITQTGNSTAEGIVLDAALGNCNVYMNKVHDIKYTGTTSTGNITGIRTNLSNAGINNVNIYNNFVYSIGSAYAGAPSATRAVRGIYVQSLGGGSITNSINVDFNNVRMDNSSSPNLSGTCFESGATNGPVINTRNNILSNFTANQTGIANHFSMATPTATAIGNTGSISNNNDLFILNNTNGFTGIGATTTYATLLNFQTAMTQDANSIAVDPGFNSATDLHVSAIGLNNSANMTGITWVTNDVDNQVRSATPDIGADEFTPLLLDAGITVLVAPVSGTCHSSSEQVTVAIKNFASVPLDFTLNPVTVTVNITGALVQNLNFTINNNSLNSNVPLLSGASMNVPVGIINMTAIGIYTFNSHSVLAGDGNAVNDSLTAVNISYSPGTAAASTTAICAGSSTTLTLTGASAGGTIQWQSSIDGGLTWNNEVGVGSTTTNYVVTPTSDIIYQVVFCGNLVSNSVPVSYFAITSPIVADTTVCGPGVVNLTATGNGVIHWYTVPVGGTPIATGPTYSPTVPVTTTYYVSNTTGNMTQGVGLYDNSAGGNMSASVNNLIFDVLGNCTLSGVYVYPAAAGNVIINLEDNTNAILNTITVAVTLADINQRTFIPVNFNLTPGTGMQLVRGAASVNLWRNNIGVTYPYTIPGILSITTSTSGNANYYFFYDWQINYGCESPLSPIMVTVNTPPAITVSTAATICLGGSTTLTASSANTNYSFAWTPSGSLNTSTGASVIATPPATVTYTVNANDASTGCRAMDSILVTVNFVPTFTIAATDTVICPSQADTLVVNFPLQSVGLFDNTAGGNQSASVNNLIFDVLSNCNLAGVYVYPGAAGNVIIELQDNTNAVINSVTFAVTIAQVNQRVYVPLNFNLTPATGMQLVRNAASVMLWRNNIGVTYPYTLPGVISITTSTAGAGLYYFFYDWQIQTAGPYSFAWTSLPVGFTATGDTAFVSPSVNTQYNVTVTDTITGCTAVFSTNINMPSAIVTSVAGNNSICVGDSSLLVASSTGGNGTYSYLWSNSLGTNDSVMVIPIVTTSYSVTTTDGCGSTSTTTQNVIVNAGPPSGTFTYTITGLMTFAFADATVNSTSWSWDFGDTQTSTLQNPTHVYATIGTYTVTLVASNGCGTDTSIIIIAVDGIENIPFANSVNVYPNPTNGQFNVLFNNNNNSVVSIQLYNLEGKLMQQKQINNVKAGTSVQINVEGYATGMYMLKLLGDNGTAVFKVDVQ